MDSSPQNIGFPSLTPFQVNQSNNHSGLSVEYKTPCNGIVCLPVSLFLIIGFGMETLFIFFNRCFRCN